MGQQDAVGGNMRIGDLVRYTGVGADLGVGMVVEKRIHGGYWAYFPIIGDYFAFSDDCDDWEYLCK